MKAVIHRTLVLSLLLLGLSSAAVAQVRIIQTNSRGDNIHLIDPVTNQIVGEVKGVPINHGAAALPDGSRSFSAARRSRRCTSWTARRCRPPRRSR
jgi:hypothetical protein